MNLSLKTFLSISRGLTPKHKIKEGVYGGGKGGTSTETVNGIVDRYVILLIYCNNSGTFMSQSVVEIYDSYII